MRRLVTALALLSTLAGAAEPPVHPEARARFRAGVALMSDPGGARVEEAYRLFKEAYALSPSWKILGNLGATAMRLERHGEAIDAFTRYLDEGGAELDPAERAQIERDLGTLRAGSAPLAIAAPGGDGTLRVEDTRARADGGVVRTTYEVPRAEASRLLVALGKHRLTTTIDGRAAAWEGEIGTTGAEVRFVVAPVAERADAPTPAPRPPRRSTTRTAGLVAVSAGGAMVAAGLVTAVIGQRKKVALDDACPGKTCPESRRGDVDALRHWAAATNVLLIGGGLVAAGGVTTLALDRDRAATITWGPASLTLSGRF
ncbi:MAG: hypothetical protein IT374_18135 [Polyangiaceae bacterium]|nr:hypothetical protein [Polyangiaceae bacterium]